MDYSANSKSQLELSRNTQDVQALDNLRQAAQNGDKGALQEAAKQFEGIFLKMMLKSMREAQDALKDKDSPFNSQQVQFYRDMHDQQLATDLSANGSLGLADIIVRQLGGQEEGFMPAAAIRNDGNLSSINRHSHQQMMAAQQQVLGGSESNQSSVNQSKQKLSAFESRQAFVNEILPVAQAAAEKLGIDPKAMVAQAAVETGWGQYMIHNHKGENSHNLFGIKADNRWQGDRAMVSTLEYEDGVAKTKQAPFRSYPSFAESVDDYVNFVKESPRYQEALNHKTETKRYFSELQQAGYATDPSYAEKVMSVLEGDTLKGLLP